MYHRLNDCHERLQNPGEPWGSPVYLLFFASLVLNQRFCSSRQAVNPSMTTFPKIKCKHKWNTTAELAAERSWSVERRERAFLISSKVALAASFLGQLAKSWLCRQTNNHVCAQNHPTSSLNCPDSLSQHVVKQLAAAGLGWRCSEASRV